MGRYVDQKQIDSEYISFQKQTETLMSLSKYPSMVGGEPHLNFSAPSWLHAP